MKKISKYLITAVSIFTLAGCGGGSNFSPVSEGSDSAGHNIRMEKNVAYDIQKGDEIEKISENPELKVDANLSSGKTTVTLISGEAAIIKK